VMRWPAQPDRSVPGQDVCEVGVDCVLAGGRGCIPHAARVLDGVDPTIQIEEPQVRDFKLVMFLRPEKNRSSLMMDCGMVADLWSELTSKPVVRRTENV